MTNLNLPRLGVGTNQFGRKVDIATAEVILVASVEVGAHFIDTAEMYGNGESERVIGEALRRCGLRDRMLIATKFSPSSDPVAACEASLQRLQTEWIDLYQLHFPNPSIPIEQTLEALARLIEQGKVRAIGSSNFAGWQIADADWTARTRGFPAFVTAQNRYSVLERSAEKDVIPACRHFGLRLIPYYPLAAGMLTGKYRRGEAPPDGSRLSSSPAAPQFLSDLMFDRLDEVEAFAIEAGEPLLSVALGGLASMPGVGCVIAGVTSAEQLRQNAAAVQWKPTEEALGRLMSLSTS